TQGNLVLDRFWLDTARNTSLAYQSAVGDEAAAFIAEKQPDVVIATDDEAIRLVVRPSDSEGIPFVFTGLNSDPDNFLLAGKRNVTGVLERPHVAETLEWVKRVQPDAQSVTYLFDSSPTTFMSWPHIMLSLRGSDIAARYLHVAYSYEEWQERVLEASERGGVLIVGRYNTLKDHSGNLIAPEEVMRWTVENSAVPVVALWSHTVEEGALGGAVITGEMQGYEAGALAVRVLQGEAPLEIGFVTPRRAQLVLNSTAAEHWNVSFPLDLLEVSTVYGSQNQAG
ncbi:MAG: hypothetical protein GXY36_05710, partial [Chloroflexi bacterium]|nr:hypothetical protein [Chloroflexota bacterium]